MNSKDDQIFNALQGGFHSLLTPQPRPALVARQAMAAYLREAIDRQHANRLMPDLRIHALYFQVLGAAIPELSAAAEALYAGRGLREVLDDHRLWAEYTRVYG